MKECTAFRVAGGARQGAAVGDGFVLFDTGGSNQRAELQRELEQAGCRPGNLRLIVLTHGDFDHSGNPAHLRPVYGAPIAMPPDDAAGGRATRRYGITEQVRLEDEER